MAACDYRLCDVCGRKAFYDSNLNYENPRDGRPSVRGRDYALDYLGDWAVLCDDCAKTHRCVIERLEAERE